MTWYFWFMRHGQKTPDEGDITLLGEAQCQRTAQAHLVGPSNALRGVFASDQRRAQRSVEVALRALGLRDQHDVRVDPLLSYTSAPPDSRPFEEVQREVVARHGDGTRVQHWLDHWETAAALRDQLIQFMLREVRAHPGGGSFLIGTHSPLGELAHPTPPDAPMLGCGDIVRYTVRLNDGVLTITDAEYFLCPMRA